MKITRIKGLWDDYVKKIESTTMMLYNDGKRRLHNYMSNLMLGIILGLWSGVAMVLDLSGLGVRTPIITGLIAGILCGNVPLGLEIGGVMLLNSLGFYTYGGATIPDFVTATIFGTVVGAKTGDTNVGLVAAEAVSLLMTQMDILGRSATTVFQHMGEADLAKNNIKKFELDTLLGTIPWALSRMLPVVIGMLFVDHISDLLTFINSISWVQRGFTAAANVLRVVGFALLLSYMDIKKYWPFLVLGFLLFAYAKMDTVALALIGLAAAALYLRGGLN